MKAAADPATIQYRRGASSPLKAADQHRQSLGDYTTPQESDISADFCGSDIPSPLSVNSAGSSERLLSPVDSHRGNSEISDDCQSPLDKNHNFMDIDMIPSTNSPCTQEDEACDGMNKSSSGYNTKEHRQQGQTPIQTGKVSEEKEAFNSESVNEESHNGETDPKQMVDIVGDASSPGEFLDQALEFINCGRKSEQEPWQSSERKKSRSRDYDAESPATKRRKPSDTGVATAYNVRHSDTMSSHSYYSDVDNEIKAEHPRRRGGDKKEYAESKPFYPSEYQPMQHRETLVPSLTSDQKLFVEAFKREVANAAEHAAEASALRVLEILEASGIYFGRSPFKQNQYDPNCTSRRRLTPQRGLEDTKRPVATSSPAIEVKGNVGDKEEGKSSSRFLSNTRFSEDKDGQIRTSNQSQLCFGSVRLNSTEGLEQDISSETIDLTTGGNRKQPPGFNESNKRNTEPKRNERAPDDEQTQALSLVTKFSPSHGPPKDASVSPSKIACDEPKAATSAGHVALLDPFVRHTLAAAKNSFVPPLQGFPMPPSFGSHLDYASNPLSKYIPGGSTDASDKRAPRPREERVNERLLDFSPFSLAAASSLKAKTSLKTRVSPVYKDEKRSPPRREEKLRQDMMLPTSLGLHGIPNSSAFRRHETQRQRSPTTTGMRSLRSNGSPDRKPFHPPNPLGVMYPFPALPLFPGVHQTSHFAAVLASMNQRRHGHNDFGDVRNGPSNAPSERIPVPQSLRGHPGSFIGDHLRYEVDGSNYAFPSNMQEGLTPQHLKKAKLIFFYTRYPNANTLKTYFPDVKFTRAITSQLIKWFSNFREFFYIQMEKFARQAVTDGVVDASVLRVTRDSELFRVLNLHYNKCNEFYVPETFITAAEASQREFFNAVRAGKDNDPAWKKVIYKIICKLDSEIPEIFKSPNVLDRLHEIRD